MGEFDSIKAGMSHELVLIVEDKHTVSHTKIAILSTPMMIGLMEKVSASMVHPLLPPNFTTVGYEVNVKHKAPASLGSEIEVSSKLLEVDGRKLLFEVWVKEGEKVIGEGFHRRTMVPIPA